MSVPRRHISELRSQYTLEPSLRDVYVEGPFDVDIVSAHVAGPNRKVYPVDVVDVSSSIVYNHGLTPGEKAELIVLMRELKCVSHDVRFVIDKDTDHWFPPLEHGPGLRWTRWCSLELYFYDELQVRDLLTRAGRCKIADWNAYWSDMRNALNDMYVMRLAARELGLAIKWIPINKYITCDKHSLKFRGAEYLSNQLQKDGCSARISDFKSAQSSWKQRLQCDAREAIRGHDFTSILALTVRKLGSATSLETPDGIERLMVMLSSSATSIQQLVA